MKKLLFTLLGISVILFADYLILILIGSTANFLGASDAFYCSTYCIIALLLCGFSLLGLSYPLWRKAIYNNK